MHEIQPVLLTEMASSFLVLSQYEYMRVISS